MLDMHGHYVLELSDGTSPRGELHAHNDASLKVVHSEAAELIELRVFLDGGNAEGSEVGRARLELVVEVGSGRMRGVVHVPFGRGQEANLMLNHLEGSARLDAGILHVTLQGTSRQGDVTLQGALEVEVGARPSVVLDPASLVLEAQTLTIDLNGLHVVPPRPLGVAKFSALMPTGWGDTQGTTARAVARAHGFATYQVSAGLPFENDAQLEMEAQRARTRAIPTATKTHVVQLAPHCFVVRHEGARAGAAFYGWVDFREAGFGVHANLTGIPNPDAWNDVFAKLVASIRATKA